MHAGITKDLKNLSNAEKAKILSGFFKTGKGQYGEGDIFLGISVPQSREIAKKYNAIDFITIKKLLESKVHEHRLVALIILVERFKKADDINRKEIFQFYLKNKSHVNNWDLVDLSADKIVGEYLYDKNKALLYKLAKSKNLWEKRMAIVSTFAFNKKGKLDETFRISELLLNDKHDLIHKACGWMLREAGKKNKNKEEVFLKKHYKKMPRTMLRYAIERFDKQKKEFYMRK